MLRARVNQELASARDADTAELIGRNTGNSGGETGVNFPIFVRNVGNGVARNVKVWLAFDAPGVTPEKATTATASSYALGAIAPGDEPLKFVLAQTAAMAGGRMPRDGLIVASWNDGGGDHVDAIGKLTVFV